MSCGQSPVQFRVCPVTYSFFLVEVEMGWTTAAAFDVKLDAGGEEAMRYHNMVDTCPIISLAHRDLRVTTCPMK